jgi:protein subunit release factor A
VGCTKHKCFGTLEAMKKLTFTKKDFKITWFSGSGAGGQHRNKHENCCRIKHIETGIITSCQEHKSAYQNKRVAFEKMAKLLLNHYSVKGEEYTRPTVVTRTYKETKDLVIDHVTGKKYSYKNTVGKNDISVIIEDRIQHRTDENV